MKYLTIIFIIYFQFLDLRYTAAESQAYCIYNRTDYSYVNVTKTREMKRFLSWARTKKIEKYVELEPIAKIIPVRGCCEGYEKTEQETCEPRCREGCPANSKCVEPEVCKCAEGYFSTLSKTDGKHYCEPICEKTCPEHSVCVKPNECACHTGYRIAEGPICRPHCPSGCPFQGKCVAPNQCECPEGYRAERGTCEPICSLGDQCKNGTCVEREKCQCNIGFVMNEETQKCEPNLNGKETYQPLEDHNTADELDTTEKQPEIETDIDTWKEDIDPNQVFDETFESTTVSQSWSPNGEDETDQTKCPDDYVRYRGQCQPLKFAIDEIDCRLQACSDPKAICTENGTCTCQEGYRMLKKTFSKRETTESPKQVVKSVCLSAEEYANFMSDPSQNGDEEIIVEMEQSSNILTICLITLGVLLLTGALIFLGLRFIRRQREEMDVEGKQLECAYDNRVCSDAEKSVI
ncbi:nimrod C4 [Musca autumnalis]|uniref:nimrod C4 n=1 Tax=Musca autumnalis TaxID=221902 RepID=UPI003CF8B96F